MEKEEYRIFRISVADAEQHDLELFCIIVLMKRPME